MFSIFIYIMSRVTHSEPGLPMVFPVGDSINKDCSGEYRRSVFDVCSGMERNQNSKLRKQ